VSAGPVDPCRLGAAEAARRIAAGDLSSAALVAACLERIAAREDTVHAWAHLDAGAALAQARARDAEPARGPLHGVPVGVKDIVDTADLPTERGSAIHAGRRPAADAACVARLRAAGAVILGKTVTTEFAYFSPGPTRNPADPARTPGGSSSGSAAAVADAMVPVAIGSQTAGSVIRPAAFCGVLGLKPTRGLVDLTGVMALSGNLDTLGWFAREAEDLALVARVLADDWPGAPGDRPAAPAADAEIGDGGADDHDGAAPAFALARTPWWDRADADAHHAVTRAAERLAAAGAAVRDLDLPAPFAPLPEAQEALMAFDMARSLAHEHEHHAEEMSDVLRALLDRGRTIDRAVAADAVARGAECRALLAGTLAPGETLLVPAASGEPPPFAEGVTGDPLFCRPWTLLGVPALSVPGATGSHGAPVGVQLVAPARADAALVAAGAWAVRQLN
jgi:Asp-tRNA(Asn)/Glu-tRNA(Gln) amidotransferase A subunit family amidase